MTGGQINRDAPGETLAFAKMQGLGNDFVVIAEKDLMAGRIGSGIVRNQEKEYSRLAKALCNRHFGVGADGLIVVKDTDRPDCDFAWTYINNDGSPSDMCGNGLRCVALWALDRGWVESKQFTVSTAIGPVPVKFEDLNHITVDLGTPVLDSKKIPVSGPSREKVVKETLEVKGKKLVGTCVSMGNPHCVIFEPGINPLDYDIWAPQLQALELFPEGVNIEFVVTEDPKCARVFVWERGCGPTLACASGAAAVVVAGVLENRLNRRPRMTS
jgi:diaminopimelate epimerase